MVLGLPNPVVTKGINVVRNTPDRGLHWTLAAAEKCMLEEDKSFVH